MIKFQPKLSSLYHSPGSIYLKMREFVYKLFELYNLKITIMIKQLKQIDGTISLSKNQQKAVNGGLDLYVSSCSPAVQGALCHAEGGYDGRCVGFVCSPNCVH